MAGPVASVLLREPLGPEQRQNLRWFLHAISKDQEEFQGYMGSGYLSVIRKKEDVVMRSHDYSASGLPRRSYLFAMCNKPEDHRDLGLLALYFAELFDGIIDLGGTIVPLRLYTTATFEGKWDDVADQVDVWLDGMPGIIHTIRYRTGEEDDDVTVYHICDAEFMRGWLAHPDFRMVK